MHNDLEKISVELLIESKSHPERIVSVSRTDDVLTAAKILKDSKVGLALVMDGDRLEGVISERDIVRRWISSPRFPEIVKVEEIMTAQVEYVTALDNVQDCYLRFVTVGCRHLPVLDPMKQVIGVLSIRDVADFLVTELSKKNISSKKKKKSKSELPKTS